MWELGHWVCFLRISFNTSEWIQKRKNKSKKKTFIIVWETPAVQFSFVCSPTPAQFYYCGDKLQSKTALLPLPELLGAFQRQLGALN